MGAPPKFAKTLAEWRRQLTFEQFRVTRMRHTEAPYSGAWWNCHERGTYCCVCCGTPLFSSETKFDSGTGWPSFYAVLDPGRIGEAEDLSLLMRRTEVHCRACEAHLGHVFPDGPPPTGQRYCINSAALNLVRESDA